MRFSVFVIVFLVIGLLSSLFVIQTTNNLLSAQLADMQFLVQKFSDNNDLFGSLNDFTSQLEFEDETGSSQSSDCANMRKNLKEIKNQKIQLGKKFDHYGIEELAKAESRLVAKISRLCE